MAEVDTSIYPKAAAPVNPLTMLGQFAGAQNALNTNRLFQSEFAARTGMGAAAQRATNPLTGDLDRAAFMREVIENPDTAFMAVEANKGALANERAQTDARNAQFDLALKHANYAANLNASLAAKPDATYKEWVDTIAGAVNLPGGPGHPEGSLLSPQHAAMILKAVPVGDTPEAKAARLDLARRNYAVLQAQAGQLSQLIGDQRLINNGQSLQPGVQGSAIMGGGFTPMGAPISTFPTRGELAGRVTGPPDQSGAPTTVPLSAVTPPDLGGPAVTSGLPVRPAAPAAVAPAAPMAIARPRAAAAASAPPAVTGGALPGQITTALPPGQAEGAQAAGRGSGEGLNALHQSVATSAPRIFQLNKALTSLQNAGATGPGTTQRNEIASFLQSLPLVQAGKWLPGVNADQIKNFDEAAKYLTQYASGQAGSMGAGTDAKLATALSGNASTHISNLAAQDVVKASIGLERMQQAQAQAFHEAKIPESQFYNWSTEWNKNIDPRAFIVDKLDKGQREKLFADLDKKPEEKKQFLSTLRYAAKGGLVRPPE